MLTVSSISVLLSTINPATSNEVYVEGYTNPGDLGGGEFYHKSSGSPDGGTIFASSGYGGCWFRVMNGTRVNARWFGAYGNGSTDDTASIQNAIDYCGATKLGLYLSGGTYIVSAPNSWTPCLRIHDNNFFMEGDGAESEIKGANGTSNQCLLGIQANSGQIQNVTVRNMRMNGNKSNQSGTWNSFGVVVYVLNAVSDPLNVTLDGLFCHSAYMYNTYEGGGIAVVGDDQSYNMLEYNTQNIVIKNCFCWDNTGWGIGTNFANGIIISDNVCWNNDTQGIALWNTQDSVVNGNKCYGNGSVGINLEICDRITVSNNNAKSTLLGAIRLDNSVDIVVCGNTCELSASYYTYFTIGLESGIGANSGAYKTRPCQNIQISNNVFKSVGSEGYVVKVYTDGGYADNTAIFINDNVIINTVTFKGMEVTATDAIVANNKIEGTVYFNSGAGFITIDSNDISYNNAPGAFNLVTIAYCSNLVIKGNLLRCNQYGDGAIFLFQYNPNIIIFDNIRQGSFSQYYRVDSPAVLPGSSVRDNLSW